jgi:1-acyl-sn-glycerol-3-phosphate acyltransferase
MRVFFTQIKAILIAVLLFSFFIPLCFLVIPLPLSRRLKITCPVWQWGSSIMLRYACEMNIDVSEDHRSPEFKGVPAYGLYVANHQSYIDIPMIITIYQVPPIMKKEVLYIPFVGLLGWICGAMPVSRSKQGSRKRVFIQTKERILNERIGVQVYPEGTRSKTAHPKTMEEIKRTLMVFAWNEKIPVIPTSVYGTRGVLSPKGAVQPGRHAGIIVHKEIRPEDYTTAEEFSVACWGKVIEGYERMRSQLEPLNKSLSSV